MSSSDNLKSFVSKLNDRNLQRKRESGVTSYALYAVLLFCTYKLYKNLSFYVIKVEKIDYSNAIHLVCFIANALVAIYFVLNTFHKDKRAFSNLKVIKYNTKNFDLLEYLALLFIFLIPIPSLVYSFLYKGDIFHSSYYIFLGILNLISIIIICAPIFPSKKEIKIYDRKNKEEYLWIEISIIIISLLVIYFSLNNAIRIDLFEKFVFIKIVVLFYAILFLLEKTAQQEKRDINTLNLEDFEYEIYLKNLDSDEIRKRLQENYVGYFIDHWIAYNLKDFKLFKDEINNTVLSVKKEIIELNENVDKSKYPIEHEARRKVILSKVKKELEAKLPKYEKLLVDISKIIKDERNLTQTEITQLNSLKSDLTDTMLNYKQELK